MQYMKLDVAQRAELLASLAGMPAYLKAAFSGLGSEPLRASGPDGGFSPVEHVWHLADLEREGFAERIRKLRSEHEPHLPDFDGARIAAERNYRSLSFQDGLAAFTAAREKNLSVLRTLDAQSWMRNGTQEGVGKVSLCDIPSFMLQHDAAHRSEIESWKRAMRDA
ncbi:MAG TPA: DinB family protein [Burkholderiales bacterium]|jgi:hypothetical protein|nr:DinB family protein [Burkholderiales bacterium]